MYYLRSKAASEANQFGIDIDKIKKIEQMIGKTTTNDPVKVVSSEPGPELKPCKFIPKSKRKPGECLVCQS